MDKSVRNARIFAIVVFVLFLMAGSAAVIAR